MEKFLIIDIETIPIDNPEQALEPFMENLRTRSKVDPMKVAAELADKKRNFIDKAALSPLSSRVACIGYAEVTMRDEQDLETVANKVEYGMIKFGNEFAMLMEFKALVEKYQHLVTFNGRSFDFPYLMFRAALHDIPLKLPTYYKNTRDGHFDLAQHLADLSLITNLDSAQQYVSMSKWCRYFGYPEKSMDSRNIKKYLQEGKEDEVYEYCIGDIEITFRLLKKFVHHYERSFSR